MASVKTVINQKELCKKIINLDPKIRCSMLINDKGKYITGASKSNVVFRVDKNHREMLFMELALRTRMRREFDYCFGTVRIVISLRDDIVIMTTPFENDILYISAEKGFDFCNTPFKILDMLKTEIA